MRSERQETIADIVREMREDIPRVVDAKVILRNYAARIEAAAEREVSRERQDSPAAKAAKAAGKEREETFSAAKERRRRGEKRLHTLSPSLCSLRSLRQKKTPSLRPEKENPVAKESEAAND